MRASLVPARAGALSSYLSLVRAFYSPAAAASLCLYLNGREQSRFPRYKREAISDGKRRSGKRSSGTETEFLIWRVSRDNGAQEEEEERKQADTAAAEEERGTGCSSGRGVNRRTAVQMNLSSASIVCASE